MSLIKIDSKRDGIKEKTNTVNLEIETPSDIKIWLVDPTYTQQQISKIQQVD